MGTDERIKDVHRLNNYAAFYILVWNNLKGVQLNEKNQDVKLCFHKSGN